MPNDGFLTLVQSSREPSDVCEKVIDGMRHSFSEIILLAQFRAENGRHPGSHGRIELE